ncbi:MAG: hypothetical protein ABII80_04035, partial [bacterium]
MKVVKYLGYLFIVGGLVFGGLSLGKNIVNFETKSELAEKRVRISGLLANIFLMKQGYFSSVTKIETSFVFVNNFGEEDGYVLRNSQKNVFVQSASFSQIGKLVKITAKYNPEQFDYIVSQPDWLESDMLTYLCLVLDPNKPNPDQCRNVAKDYMIWTNKFHLSEIVKISNKVVGFQLVKKVKAAYCSGTVKCGGWDQDCVCNNRAKDGCKLSGQSCGTFGDMGTCVCGSLYCNTKLNPNYCSSFSDSPTTCSTITAGDC